MKQQSIVIPEREVIFVLPERDPDPLQYLFDPDKSLKNLILLSILPPAVKQVFKCQMDLKHLSGVLAMHMPGR